MGVSSQRIDLEQLGQVGSILKLLSPARRSSNRRCRSGFTTPVTKKDCRLPGAQLLVWSSLIRRSFGKGLDTGRYEMAPVRCTCSRLAALHCVPRMLFLLLFSCQERLRMISEALDFREERGRFSHS